MNTVMFADLYFAVFKK